MMSFMAASGISDLFRLGVVSNGDAGMAEWSLSQPFALIGRDERSDVRLEDDQVSRRHVYLQVIGGEVFCVDLLSRLGVWWEDESRRFGWVRRGQAVGVGPYRLVVMPGAEADVPAASARPDPMAPWPSGGGPLPGEGLVLEVVDRTTVLTRWRIDRELALVGRSADCSLQLADASVSRYHCSLVSTPEGLWVVDLLGKDGVWVNGVAVSHAVVADGDDIHVGRFLIRVRSGRALTPAASVSLARVASTPNLPRNRPAVTVAGCTPARRAGRGVVESVLVPLVEQFGRMQRQFNDQLALTMSAQQQMFEQLVEAVNVVQELSSTQRKQAVLVREELDEIRQLSKELRSIQAQFIAGPTVENGARRPRSDGDARRPRSNGANRDPEASRDTTASRASEPRPAPPPETATADSSIHVLLCKRIAEIQQERQSRWERIVGLLRGR
jgi:pSer/pThr/pTyr-binding forkhead associated (FHA) protein